MTSGMQSAGSVIGELYVEYAFELADPVQPLATLNPFYQYKFSTSSSTAADPFANLLSSSNNPIGAGLLTVGGATNNRIQFPNSWYGTYFTVTVNVYGSSISAAGASAVGGLTQYAYYFGATTFSFNTAAYAIWQTAYSMTSASTYITMPASAFGASAVFNNIDIFITRINTTPPITYEGRVKQPSLRTLFAEIEQLKLRAKQEYDEDPDECVETINSETFATLSQNQLLLRQEKLRLQKHK